MVKRIINYSIIVARHTNPHVDSLEASLCPCVSPETINAVAMQHDLRRDLVILVVAHEQGIALPFVLDPFA